jgi:hypothetical protein
VKYGEGEAEVEGEQGPVRIAIVSKEREGQQMIHRLKIPEPAGISMSKKDGDESLALRLDGWLFKRVLGYYERKT